MNAGKLILRFLVALIVVFLQVVMTQVVTFLFSFFFPGGEDFPQTHPLPFILILTLTYTIAIVGTGWLALKLRWIQAAPRSWFRVVATLVGVLLPLVVALFVYPALEPGNPSFFIAILTGLLGFYLPGWFGKRPTISSAPAAR